MLAINELAYKKYNPHFSVKRIELIVNKNEIEQAKEMFNCPDFLGKEKNCLKFGNKSEKKDRQLLLYILDKAISLEHFYILNFGNKPGLVTIDFKTLYY